MVVLNLKQKASFLHLHELFLVELFARLPEISVTEERGRERFF